MQRWKSRNSSSLPVEGKVFSLTFPFIEQPLALKTHAQRVSEWRYSATIDRRHYFRKRNEPRVRRSILRPCS